jgi:DNA-binding transcriptional LysR family regulator
MDRLGAMAQFVRVVEAGSFSAAARILRQGQPAISKAVAQWEERLGVALFIRTTRTITLTDAGRVFYQHAKTTLDAAEEAEAAAKGAGVSLTGRLRICAPVTFARLHIIPSLSTFMTAHPGLELDLILDDRRIDLVEEGIDIAIRAGAMADSTMVATHIAEGRRQVVATPGFWRKHEPLRSPSDLSAMPFIAYGEAPSGLDWIFAKNGKTDLVRMNPCLRVSALEGIREAAFAGLGFAIVSEWSTRDAIDDGLISAKFEDYQLPSVDLWAIFPAGRQPSARARAFAAHIRPLLNRGVVLGRSC